MEYNTILFEVVGSVATVTLNRPQALNALNSELLHELDDVLDAISENPEIRCVILTGAGEKAFVSGADIKEMKDNSAVEARRMALYGQSVITKLERLPQPTIAAVNGFALGGGCEMAMACDIRIASSKARFGQPEVKLGIMAGYGGTQRLPRLVGMGIAKEILLTGDIVPAERALAIGLVNHVVEPDQLLAFTKDMANRISQQGTLGVQLSKQAVNDGLNMDLDKSLLHEADLFAVCFSHEEHNEGIAAFIEKRAPKF